MELGFEENPRAKPELSKEIPELYRNMHECSETWRCSVKGCELFDCSSDNFAYYSDYLYDQEWTRLFLERSPWLTEVYDFKDAEEMCNEQYVLLGSQVMAYVFRLKTWRKFSPLFREILQDDKS